METISYGANRQIVQREWKVKSFGQISEGQSKEFDYKTKVSRIKNKAGI